MSIFANVESAQKALTSGPDLTRDVSNGGRSFLRFGGLDEITC